MDTQISYLDFEKDKPALISIVKYTLIEENNYLVSLTDSEPLMYINSNTYYMLRLIDGKNTYATISKLLSKQTGIIISPGDIYSLIHMGAIGTLAFTSDKQQPISLRSGIDNIKLKLIFIPEKYVYILCNKLAVLYDTLFFSKILIFGLVFNFCYTINLYISHSSQHSLNSHDLLLVYLVVMATVIIHELGHAAACVANKVKPGGIGFGFYLISPIFFADVTDTWSLNSKKRLIVDFGGIYLDMILCAILNIYLMYSYNDFLFKIVIAKMLITAANLNPFLRFDGYWILSDFLNIQNMKEKANKCFILLVKTLFSFRFSEKISKKQIFLGFYGSVSWLMIGLFLTFAVKNNIHDIISLPKNAWITASTIAWGGFSLAEALAQVRKLIMPVLFYYFLFTLVNPYRRKVSRFFFATKS